MKCSYRLIFVRNGSISRIRKSKHGLTRRENGQNSICQCLEGRPNSKNQEKSTASLENLLVYFYKLSSTLRRDPSFKVYFWTYRIPGGFFAAARLLWEVAQEKGFHSDSWANGSALKCNYLNGDGVRLSPDGHRVQTAICQARDSTAKHLGISVAAQLVPQLQFIFADTQDEIILLDFISIVCHSLQDTPQMRL